MEMGDHLSSAMTLGIALPVGLLSCLMLFWFVRSTWRWIVGKDQGSTSDQWREPEKASGQPLSASGVSASDLFVIRSNLNAVARQIEDLERRLRFEQSHKVKELASTRD
jgi:hypothetical protein